MPKEILLNPGITVDGVDLSDHCSQVDITDSSDEVDVTSFGATNKEILLGLGDGTISATFFQDFASGSVDATLSAVAKQNDPFAVVVKNDKTSPTATWTMQAVLPEYHPLAGSVGEASTIEAAFRNAEQTGIVKS
jgi:hypothetical protein